MQYSISNWIYATEDLEKSFQRLAKYKYDAVELKGGVTENIFDQYAAESIMGLKYFERIT